jgi:hypothetical protein
VVFKIRQHLKNCLNAKYVISFPRMWYIENIFFKIIHWKHSSHHKKVVFFALVFFFWNCPIFFVDFHNN